eukprot:1173986-Rhodomonas_salina.3
MGSCCLNALYLTLMKKFQDAHPEHSSVLIHLSFGVYGLGFRGSGLWARVCNSGFTLQMQGTTFSVHIVRGMRFLVFEFAVEALGFRV